MRARVDIQEISPDAVATEQYRCFVAALGYETRARFASQELQPHADKRVALGFGGSAALALNDNRRFFASAGFEIEDVDRRGFQTRVRGLLQQGDAKYLCDISSMNRYRLSEIVYAAVTGARSGPIVVDFVYSIAAYSPPSSKGLVSQFGPVSPAYAGVSSTPDEPVSVILGLGREQDRALGALELLEPQKLWVFVPWGIDPRYDEDIYPANELLLSRVPESRQLKYRVDQPASLYARLGSLVHGGLMNERPLILPFGPKIFALVSILVAAPNPTVAVWRVSSNETDNKKDRLPHGTIAAIRATFAASDPS